MQQQRLEQDRQMELLTKELVGVENQLSQSKIVKAEEKDSSKGAPVLPTLKMVLDLKTEVVIGNLQSMAVCRQITAIFHLMNQLQILLACAAQDLVARLLSTKIMRRGLKVSILELAQH